MGAWKRAPLTIAAAVIVISPAFPAPARAAAPAASSPGATVTAKVAKFPRCSALQRKFPHGVGRVGARDRTSNAYKVRNFYRSNVWYRANAHLDRDKDGIACEKR